MKWEAGVSLKKATPSDTAQGEYLEDLKLSSYHTPVQTFLELLAADVPRILSLTTFFPYCVYSLASSLGIPGSYTFLSLKGPGGLWAHPEN
jgi:hypothetical protein